MRWATTCLVLAQALTGCARQQAESSAVPAAGAAARVAAPATGSAGVRVFIDPVTGEMRAPTAAESAAAHAAEAAQVGQPAAAAVKVAPDVVVTPLPGGITEYSVNGGVQVDETACVQQDGRIAECDAAQKAALRATAKPDRP